MAELRTTLTPGTPGHVGTNTQDEASMVPPEDETKYKSVVGTLLYLTKHSRPDITNAVRELSKTMNKSSMANKKEVVSDQGSA